MGDVFSSVHGRRSRPFTRATGVAFVHLAVLSSLAIAQPLFDLLGKNAEFFAAHDSGAREVIVFALALILLPPLALLVIEVVAGVLDERLRDWLHYLFVGGLAALFAVYALKKRMELPTPRWLLCAAAVTVAAALAYRALRGVRLFLSVLAPAPLVFVVLFLFFSPVESFITPPHAQAASSRIARDVPVVFVILDELSVTSLMNADHEVDAARFPNFARLAHDATWFRTVTTVHEGTAGAVPAIMTGIYPRRHRFPIYKYHPRNVFTLLGRSYQMQVAETITHLCPVDVCRSLILNQSFRGRMSTLSSDTAVVYAHMVVPDDQERRIPAVNLSWAHFRGKAARSIGRIALFRRFVDALDDAGPRSLTLIHLELPHVPWVFLPSCHEYGDALPVAAGVLGRDVWARNWLVVQAFQRYLLQVQCTDRLIGRLLDRMKENGTYDRSLLVVTADHGVSLGFGEHRRELTPTNAGDILFPPLFVKLPDQRAPRIVDRHVQTIDIVPTIAGVLGIRIPWRVDGTSLLTAGKPLPRVHAMTADTVVRTPVRDALKQREATLVRQLRLFHGGLYRIGRHPELVGRSIDSLPVESADGIRASVSRELLPLLRDLPPGATVIPTPVVGGISGPGVGPTTSVAVAINRKIAAVSPVYRSRSSWAYSALAPESVFRPGANAVDVFSVERRYGSLVLHRLYHLAP